MDLAGAVFNADVVGEFSSHGGKQAYFFGYEPTELISRAELRGVGQQHALLADAKGQMQERMPSYHAARMLTHAWADSVGGVHAMVAATVSSQADPSIAKLVSAFALRRPDRRISLLLINRDPSHAMAITTALEGETRGNSRAPNGPVDTWQYSSAQYRFLQDGEHGHPVLNQPPLFQRSVAMPARITLPPNSITVVTGW